VAVIAGITASLLAVVLAAVIAILLSRRFHQRRRSSSGDAASAPDLEFVAHSLADSTVDTLFHDTVTYEGALPALPSRGFELNPLDGNGAPNLLFQSLLNG
jgi:hypothetical protein